MMASTTADGRTRALVAPVLLLVVLLVVHSLDHSLRQSATVPAEAAVAGLAGLGVALVALALAAAGSRLAPAATAFAGLATAVGFVAVHVVPEWSVFSQPYADIPVDAVSWTAMLVPAFAAAGVGALGLSRLRMPA
jgi:hypothetical protein